MKKTKKILSILLALSTVISSFVLPVAVQAEKLVADDYVPGAKNPNLLNHKYGVNWYFANGQAFPRCGGDVQSGRVTDTTDWKMYVVNDELEFDPWHGLHGFRLNKNVTEPIAFSKDKSYVFQTSLKDLSPEGVGTAKAEIALYHRANGEYSISYSKEYVGEGKELSSEYKPFNATIKPASGFDDASETEYIILGFPDGSVKDMAMSLDVSGSEPAYFAEEQAYDITNTVISGEVVTVGGTAELKAEVTNQLGLSGYLDQSFTWYVLNDDKTELAEGITVITDSCTQNATVNVSENAAEGVYSIVAVADSYSGMVKTAKIQVVDNKNFRDYIPGAKNPNLLNHKYGVNWYFANGQAFARCGGDVQSGRVTDTTDWKMYVVNDELEFDPWHGLHGFRLNKNVTEPIVFSEDKSYVFQTSLRNLSPDVVGQAKAEIALFSRTSGGYLISYSKEYGGEGKKLSSEYKPFKATIKPANGFDDALETAYIILGFPDGSVKDMAMGLDVTGNEQAYFAEEQAYNISLTKLSDSETTFKAEVTNQIGLPGYLDQSFTWYAMNTDRTDFVDGITITPADDTATVTVSVNETVKSGSYDIVAISDLYGMAKGTTIIVEDNKISSPNTPTVPPGFVPGELKADITKVEAEEDNKLNVSVKYSNESNENKEFTIFAATYKDQVMSSAFVIDDVIVTPGDDEYTKTYTTGINNEFDFVKVFIWDSFDSVKPLCTAVSSDDTFILKRVGNNIQSHSDEVAMYLKDKVDSAEKYTDGTKEFDKPKPINLSWRLNKNIVGSNYTVKISESPDMTDYLEYSTTNNNIDIYNLKIGTKYYWTVSSGDNTSSVAVFTTADIAPRILNVGGVRNIRDIGGWKTDIGAVKQGKLFRSYRMNYDNSGTIANSITQEGVQILRNEMKIKTEIDLRSPSEFSLTFKESALGSDINYHNLPINYQGDYLSGNKDAIKAVFELLADENNYPIIYHCTAGADRTGMITYLINGLLGVEKDDLLRDYLITNFSKMGEFRSLSKITNLYVKTIDNYTGENLSDKVFNYLKNEVGVNEDDLNFIKSYLVE